MAQIEQPVGHSDEKDQHLLVSLDSLDTIYKHVNLKNLNLKGKVLSISTHCIGSYDKDSR